MKIRAIVCDMDGTLLKRTGGTDHIGERTRQALLEAQAQGIRLILASGRPHGRLMRYAQELHMLQHGGWLIEVNGTALYDLESGRREVLAQLHRAEIRELYAQLRSAKNRGTDLSRAVLCLTEGGVRTITSSSGIVATDTLSADEVQDILSRSGVKTYYSTRYESAYCIYRPNSYQTATLWYQSDESLAAKLQLARLFGVTKYIFV